MSAQAGDDARVHMDAIYKYQRYIYDATRKYYLLGRDRMLDDLKPPPGGTVLEVGCGTGRNLILAARRYPEAKFVGFDISRAMLETAEASIAKAGLSQQIKVAEGDATNFDMQALFDTPHADRVFVSYALSMIPPWEAAVAQSLNALAPGGELHIVDFGQQSGWPKWFQSLLFAWLRKFSVSPRANLENVLSTAAEKADAQLSFEHLYRDYAQYAVISRSATSP